MNDHDYIQMRLSERQNFDTWLKKIIRKFKTGRK